MLFYQVELHPNPSFGFLALPECWQEGPSLRPTFVEIEKRIARLDEGNNMIDSLFAKGNLVNLSNHTSNALIYLVSPSKCLPFGPKHADSQCCMVIAQKHR